MPDPSAKWGRGKYGESGGRLIARAFDQWAADKFFASPPESDRGFEARLKYVLEHAGGGEQLLAVGITQRPADIVNWLTGDVRAGRRTRERVDEAYRRMRSQNLARQLKHQLARDGRGTKVTVEPLPPSAVPPDHRTQQARLSDREVTIRPSQWNRLVDQWARGDLYAMETEWMDVCDDIDSPPSQWFEVAHVGFSI